MPTTVEPTTEPTTLTLPEPPGGTLSSGGRTVRGGLGTYCWTVDGGGGCADTFGISLGEERLAVPPGAALSFAYGGDRLSSLDVTAYEVSRGDGRFMDGVFVPNYGRGEKLGVERTGTRARIVADLPTGEYVLDAFARMPEGDASYGFRLVVERGDAAAGKGPATATVEFEPALLVDEVRRIAAEHDVEAGMIEGHYRVGGEVHAWGWTGGLGTNFDKQRNATFADADIPGETARAP